MSNEPIAESLLKRYPGLERFVGWGSLISLALAFVSQLLGNIQAIKTHLFELFGFDKLTTLHFAMVPVVSALALFGVLLLWLWIYKRFVREMSVHRRWASASVLLVASGLAGYAVYANLPAPPDMRKLLDETSRAWKAELLGLRSGDGGLRTSRTDPSADSQVWSTAQSLAAILLRPDSLTESEGHAIRDLFGFIEKLKLAGDEGWGYMEPVDWGVTEIAAWVALAYTYSMRPVAREKVWGTDAAAQASTRLAAIAKLLQRRQLANGSWAPVSQRDNPRFSRTYSTVMAVWALLEIKRSKALPADATGDSDRAIADGIRWLLATYHTGLGSWVPNPERPQQLDAFPGLTAQTLYVLSLAQADFGFVSGDERFERARREFLSGSDANPKRKFDVLTRSVSSNDRTHDSDRYLPRSKYMVEGSTFLWYPWALTYCSQMAEQKSADARTQKAGSKMCRALASRTNELLRFARGDPFVYVTAESLFSINAYLAASTSTAASRP